GPSQSATIRPSFTLSEQLRLGRSPLPSIRLPPTMSSEPFMPSAYHCGCTRGDHEKETLRADGVSEPNVIELDHVAGDDLVAILRRHVPEHALDVLRGVWIRARRMRKVGAPHHAVHTNLGSQLRRQRIVDDARKDVLLDVAARRLLLQVTEGRKPLDAIDPILEDGQPGGVVF